MDEHHQQVKQLGCYEVHNEGPITYYHYYLDEFIPSAHPLSTKRHTSARSIVSRSVVASLVGAGFAATALLGFAIVQHKRDSPQNVEPNLGEQPLKSLLLSQD